VEDRQTWADGKRLEAVANAQVQVHPEVRK
jgi:hypothetical protein